MGLGFLSTSYTGRPGKVALSGNFLGAVRNIRVKNPNHFTLPEKHVWSPVYLALFLSVNLTKRHILSINTIDKITYVCYTENKLENKIKILTNNNKNKNKKENYGNTNNKITKQSD